MPASIKTILQLDDTPLKAKLDQVKKYYNKTYNDWADATEKVTIKSEELTQQKAKLATATANLAKEKQNSNSTDKQAVSNIEKEILGRKNKIKVLMEEKRALSAISSAKKEELSVIEYGESVLKRRLDTTNQTTTATKDSTTATKNQTKSTESLANATIRYLRWAGTIAGVVYATKRAWDSTLGSGLAINKMIESNTYGIAALTSANTRMVDSLGKTLSPYKKIAMGTKIATDIMAQLRIESTKTPATFAQLTEVYQQATGQTLSMGDAFGTTVQKINQNTVELSKSFTAVAGAIGQPMDRVKEEIRSALTGNVTTDSIIATMIFGSPTEANAKIREARKHTNGLVNLFNDAFKDFKILEETRSYEKGFLQMQNSWQMAMTDIVSKSGMFKDITNLFYEMSKEINEDTDGIVKKFDSFYEIAKSVGSAIDNLTIPAAAIASFYALIGVITLLRKETIALTAAAMANPYIAAAVVIGTGVYTISEYFADEGERLKEVAKTRKYTLDQLNKQDEESLQKNRNILAEELKKQNKELTDLRLEANDYTLLEQLWLEPKNQDQKAYETKAKEVAELTKAYNIILSTIKAKDEEKTLAEKEIERLGKKSELITQIALNQDIQKDITKFITQEESKLEALQKQKAKWTEDLTINQKKLTEELKRQTVDETAKKIIQEAIAKDKEGIYATTKAISKEQQKIDEKARREAEEKAKKEATALKISQDLWVAQQKNLGVDIEKSTLMSNDLTALYLRLDATKDLEKQQLLQTEIENKKYEITQQVTAEEEDQSKARKKAFDEIAKRVKQEQVWNEEADERRQRALDDEIKKRIQLFNIKAKELTRTIDKDRSGSISTSEYQSSIDELNEAFNEANDKLVQSDEAAKAKLLENFESTKQGLDELFTDSVFELEIKLTGIDEVTTGISSIVNGLDEMTSANLEYNRALIIGGKSESEMIKLAEERNSATIDSFGGMAGAMSQYFKKGSKAQQAFHDMQMGFYTIELAVAISNLSTKMALLATETTAVNASEASKLSTVVSSATAQVQVEIAKETIKTGLKATDVASTAVTESAKASLSGGAALISAMAGLPFPLNMLAFAATASVIGGVMSQAFGGGSVGGISAPSVESGINFDANRDVIEGSYEPMTDRLDRQIDLLESIDKNGSASQLGIELASVDFERESRIWIEDVLEKARQGWAWSGTTNPVELANVEAANEAIIGVDAFNTRGTDISYNADVLREGTNLIEALVAFSDTGAYTGTLYQQAAIDAGYTWADMNTYVRIEIEKDINAYQGLIADWAMGILDSMDELKDASEDFKQSYDDITGSMFYETKRLSEAYADVDKLIGTSSFTDYLQTTIEDIADLERFFTDDVFATLMSNKAEDIDEQIRLVEELGEVTNQTFDDGAREALNYLESIQLVAEAMAVSRENIQTWNDSFKTDEQLAQDMADTIGVRLAGSMQELDKLFKMLSEDTYGLTDAELDLLEANRDLIESMGDDLVSVFDDLEQSLLDTISAIESTDSSIEKYLDKDVTFRDVDAALASGVDATNSGDVLAMIDQAYTYEKSLIDEKFKLEDDILKKQLSAVESLDAYSKNLLYDNQTELVSLKSSGKLLENSIASFSSLLMAGEDTSEAFSDIQKYTSDYFDYAAMTAKSDAEYNYAVASTANKLKAITKTDIDNQGLADAIALSIEEQAQLQADALDALTIVTVSKLSDARNALEASGLDIQTSMESQVVALEELLGSNNPTVLDLKEKLGEDTDLLAEAIADTVALDTLNFSVLEQTDQLSQLLGADSYIVQSLDSLSGGTYDSIGELTDATVSSIEALSGVYDARVADLTDGTIASVGTISTATLYSLSDITDGTLATIDGIETSTIDNLGAITDGTLATIDSIETSTIENLGSITDGTLATIDGIETSTIDNLDAITIETLNSLDEIKIALLDVVTDTTIPDSIKDLINITISSMLLGNQVVVESVGAMSEAQTSSTVSINKATIASILGMNEAMLIAVSGINNATVSSVSGMNSVVMSSVSGMNSATLYGINNIANNTMYGINNIANNMLYGMDSIANIAITNETSNFTRLIDSVNNANNSITSAILSDSGASYTSSLITQAYQDVLGRAPDTAGAAYWEQQLNTGAISSTEIYKSIAQGAIGADIDSAKDYLATHSFAVGTTNVPYDMAANIHRGEIITPKTYSDGIRSGELTMGNNKELIAEIKKLDARLANIERNTKDTSTNTKTARIA